MHYSPNPARYSSMPYRRCGHSGLRLPAISLGLWHSFGAEAPYENCRAMVLGAFDAGVTHFDLANNYGPPPGAAEQVFGRLLAGELAAHRDELVISTKAGYLMWDGPYGEWGSRKHLMASLEQSLARLGLDYVDIFYHHRPDPDTPLKETVDALADIVRSGKALYVGISNYGPQQTAEVVEALGRRGVHCLIHQMRYSMLDRANAPVLPVLEKHGVGSIAFSPLAQGILSGKYNNGIPANSRAATDKRFLNRDNIDPANVEKARLLAPVAAARSQSLPQLALAWALRSVTSVIIGASRPAQVEENLGTLNKLGFSAGELAQIEIIIG